jgi:hypothetical protein
LEENFNISENNIISVKLAKGTLGAKAFRVSGDFEFFVQSSVLSPGRRKSCFVPELVLSGE